MTGEWPIKVIRLEAEARQSNRSAWLLTPMVFLLTAGATFSLFYLRTGSAEATTSRTGPLLDPRAASLQMRVDTQSSGLLLSWNRYSPAVEAAKDGVLQIDDGGEHRQIALDRSQILEGSVFYRPASQDVSFRLDLHNGRDSDIAQILRVLDARPRVRTTEAASIRAASVPATPAPRHESDSLHAYPDPHAAAKTVTQTAPEKTPIVAASAATVPPLADDLKPPVPDPPVVSQPLSAADPGAAVLEPAASQPPPLANAQPTTPVAGNAPAPLARPAPVPGYVPPRPLKWVKLDEQSLGTAKLAQGIDVKVKIKIDDAGNVTAAHALIDGPRRDRKLMSAAAAAVRQWKFEPAKVSGANVPCEETIVLHFGPDAQ